MPLFLHKHKYKHKHTHIVSTHEVEGENNGDLAFLGRSRLKYRTPKKSNNLKHRKKAVGKNGRYPYVSLWESTGTDV